MSTKHTVGKWKAGKPEANGTPVTGPCGVTIAWCGANAVYGAAEPYRIDRYEAEANARLIAAAPETAAEQDKLREINADMLAALKAVRKFMIPGMNWTDKIGQGLKDHADAAIAKAEGRS